MFAQEAAKSESQSNNLDAEDFWGNRGVLYKKPELFKEEQAKVKAVKISPPPLKVKVTKPRPIEPPPLKPAPVKPPQLEEATETKKADEKQPEETAAPDKRIASLKARLEKTLEQLSLANQRIQELEKKLSVSKTTETYQVKKGDSLWSIAKRKEVYDNPYKWLLLYHANRDQIYDPNLIFPYMMLLIPRLEEHENKNIKQQ